MGLSKNEEWDMVWMVINSILNELDLSFLSIDGRLTPCASSRNVESSIVSSFNSCRGDVILCL